MSITLEQAQQLAEAASKKAVEIGVPMNIAVVDEGARLKLFHRMEDALMGSADIAIKKATTARLFNTGSGEMGKQSQPGGPLYAIEHTNGGLVTFAGGLPLKDALGHIVGAIGISGGEVEQDLLVATTAVESFKP